MKNGYPNHVISRNLYKKPRPQETTLDADEVNEATKRPSSFLPYIQGLSEKIQMECRKLKIRTIFKPGGTLRSVLTKVKTMTPELKKKGVVYKVSCRDCETYYIGEIGGSLQKRISEHKYSVKNNYRKNGIAVHAWDMGHQPDWDAAEVVEMEPHYWKRCVLEGMWIQKTSQTCNLDCGMIHSEAWSMLI